MSDPAFLPTAELVRKLQSGEIGSLELVDHFADRQAKHDPALHALATTDLDGARVAAKEADDRRVRGEDLGALHGLPITVKDALETAGITTTGGSEDFSGHVPDRDADAVAALREAGAIVMAKSNLPHMSDDWQSFNPLFGRTNNPWDLERTPGGSSGGAAAALSAGLTGGDIGSDIGGSIRMPASYCGLFGHKPTYGLTSPRGHVPPPPGVLAAVDLSVVGPLGRSAEDLDLLLSIMAGAGIDSPSLKVSLAAPRFSDPKNLRVAVWADDPICPVAGDVSAAVRDAAATLERLGATVDDEARPDATFQEMLEQHIVIMTAIIAGDFPKAARDWLVGYSATVTSKDKSYLALQAVGTALTYSQWLRYSERMAQTRARWTEFFERFDVVLCPTAPAPAIPHDTDTSFQHRTIEIEGKERPYMDLLPWTSLATPAHLPASVAPAAISGDGLPIGVQIIGPYGEDRTTIAVAALLEKEHMAFTAPPSFA